MRKLFFVPMLAAFLVGQVLFSPQAFAQHPASASSDGSRKIAVSAHATNGAGVSVRVKGVEIGGDFTLLDVTMSYSGKRPTKMDMARNDTYLEDESGMRIPLSVPDDNPQLSIMANRPLQGQLVFLGHIPATAKKLRLVFNDGSDGNSILWPGLNLDIPLEQQP